MNKITRRNFLQLMGASAAALALMGCSETGNRSTSLPTLSGRSLVVYYSASGNTRRVAQAIAEQLGADTFEVTPVQPYTSADLNWTNNSSRVVQEHNDESLRNIPLTSTTVPDWDSYENVFIGYPIWWGIAAWPMNGFVSANDFSGKNVVPFCTSSSSGIGQSGKRLAELAGTGNWLDGYRFSSSTTASDIATLAESLNL
mgnify:FL=1